MERGIGFIGIMVLVGIAYLLSENRKKIPWKTVAIGIMLQWIVAIMVLRINAIRELFDYLARFVTRILSFTSQGSEFIFGNLAKGDSLGVIFAFQVLPTIIYFASLMAILYYLGIMQLLVRAMAWIMSKTMKASGAESLAISANIFVGQTEAPLVIKPYIEKMTKAELTTLMTGGFATIAGSVLGAYIVFLGGNDKQACAVFAKHLLTASIMSAPAAFVIARILVPETEKSLTAGSVHIHEEKTAANLIDAAAQGASDGLKLALNVAAMLLAFLSLLALINWPLHSLGEIPMIHDWLATRGHEELNLSVILGMMFAPLAWCMGVPLQDAQQFGSLLGEKIVLTEFVAFKSLGAIMESAHPMQLRSKVMAAYALCGFANFGSIAIQIGGIGSLAPGRRSDLAKLSLRAMIGGALASWMTATIAGILWTP